MGSDKGALVFLDADRLAQDRNAGRNAETVDGRERLQLIFLTPNLEGLLIRLHGGQEALLPTAADSERRLQRLWPEYRKPMPARALEQRFGLPDLRRAAAHDAHLREALILLGLLPKA